MPIIMYLDTVRAPCLFTRTKELVMYFIREVNYQREGKGSYYFEPTHLQ